MTENEVAAALVDSAYQVHFTLGPGLLESVYELALRFELDERGLSYESQVSVPVSYKGQNLGEGLRADLIVEGIVLVELKSVVKVQPLHSKQLLTYLRLTGLHLGLLINFNVDRIKNGISRVVSGLVE